MDKLDDVSIATLKGKLQGFLLSRAYVIFYVANLA